MIARHMLYMRLLMVIVCYIHVSTPYRWQEVDDVVYASIGDAIEAMSSRHKPHIKNGISKSELDNILIERGKLLKITL